MSASSSGQAGIDYGDIQFGAPGPSVAALEARMLSPGLGGNGYPLDQLFASFGDDAAQNAGGVLMAGLTRGPIAAARDLRDVLSISQQRAEVIARNELLSSYRDAQLANYRANSDVLSGWMWSADKATACIACLDMDGQVFGWDEDMVSHVQCKCSPLPVTNGWDDILGPLGIDASDIPDTSIDATYESGQDWFTRQGEAVQRAILGPAKWEAWSRGDITLDDLLGRRDDGAWGKPIYEKSLKELGLNARDYLRGAAELPRELPTPPVEPYHLPTVAEAEQRVAAAEQQARILEDRMQRAFETGAARDAVLEDAYHRAYVELVSAQHELAQAQEAAGAVEKAATRDLSQLSDQELRALVGAPDGARIEVTSGDALRELEASREGIPSYEPVPGYTPALYMEVTDPEGGYHAFRLVLSSDDTPGRYVMENLSIGVRDQGQGLGARIFADEVRTLSARGDFERIVTEAVGSPGSLQNGYYTWARLGYDGAIPQQTLDRLQYLAQFPRGGVPAEWTSYTRISDLMATPEGRAWWKANGRAFSGTFDLTPGSYSMRTLDDYLASHGLEPIGEAAAREAEATAAGGEAEARLAALPELEHAASAEHVDALLHDQYPGIEFNFAARDPQADLWQQLAREHPEMPEFQGPHPDVMPPNLAREAGQAFAQLAQEYPAVVDRLEYVGLMDEAHMPLLRRLGMGGGGVVEAQDEGRALLFGSAWRDEAQLAHTYALNVGYTMEGGASPIGILTHEFGHLVQTDIERMPAAERAAYDAWNAKYPVNESRVSEYARKNVNERFAEAFTALQYGTQAVRDLPEVQDLGALLHDLFPTASEGGGAIARARDLDAFQYFSTTAAAQSAAEAAAAVPVDPAFLATLRDAIGTGGVQSEADARAAGQLVRDYVHEHLPPGLEDAAAELRAIQAAATADLTPEQIQWMGFGTREEAMAQRAVHGGYGPFQAQMEYSQQLRDQTVALLGQVRDLGGVDLNFASTFERFDQRVADELQSVQNLLPRDWLVASNDQGPLWAVRDRASAESGYYLPQNNWGGGKLGMHYTKDTSAEALGTLAIHELGHRMEDAVGGLWKMEAEFYNRRTAGEAFVQLTNGIDARTKVDRFADEYMGREPFISLRISEFIATATGADLGGATSGYSYELVSLGLEWVLGYDVNGARYLAQDPEFHDWILGILFGAQDDPAFDPYAGAMTLGYEGRQVP